LKTIDGADFGYRRIKIERPLRLVFTVNEEGFARLEEQSGFTALAVSKKKPGKEKDADELEGRNLQALVKKLLKHLDGATFNSRESFKTKVEELFESNGLRVKAPLMKAILSAFSKRNPLGEICSDSKGNMEGDSDLRDYETVPLKVSLADYFAREVKPHAPDAWIDESYVDEKDGQIGIVGYEIPFNRHFYVFKPPRPLDEIDAELKVVTAKIMEMLGGLSQ
jgi:type I restriction enzyme M protein